MKLLRPYLIAGVICLLFILLALSALAGTDVKVNQDIGIDLQNEISLALNPSNPSNLVAAYNDDPDKGPGSFDTGPGIGLSYTTNTGTSWNTTHTPPVWGHEFDPSVTFDTKGNIFVGFISSTTTWSWPKTNSGVFVSKSSDGGISWTQPTTVEAFAGSGVTTVPFDDKSYVACDTSSTSPYQDRLYIVWQRDSTDGVHSEIYSAYSTSQGTTFTAPLKVNDQPISVSLGNAPVPAVSPDGTLCVTWIDIDIVQANTTWVPGTIFFDKSTDGGNSFAQDTTVAVITAVRKYPFSSPFSSFRANSFPSIAVDPTNGNNIYIAYSADMGGQGDADYGDIYLVRSTDGGQTWSAPKKINDDVGTNGQFHPWVSVTPSGVVCVAWYDRRNDPLDIDLDIYYALSVDNGSTFTSNKKVNDVTIKLLTDPSAWMGEYLGLTTDSNYAYIAWTDTRNLERDIYFDKMSVDTSPPVTTLSTTPTAPDGQNTWFITTPTITLSRNEPGSTYYQWDSTSSGGWITYSTSFTASEGIHILYYFSADTSNNTEAIKNQQFKVDLTAPSTVTLSGSAASSTQIDLSWNSATDTPSGVSHYDIYDADTNSLIATTAATSYSDTGLSPGQTYRYYVKAVDVAGNESSQSNTVTITTPSGGDTQAPSAPSILSWTDLTTNSVTLSWTSSSDNVGVTGYALYNGSTDTTITTTSATSYVIAGLTPSTTYTYYVKAFDAAGNLSPASNTLQVVTAPDTSSGSVSTGSNVSVSVQTTLPDGNPTTVTVKFDSVTGAGNVGVSCSKSPPYSPSGFSFAKDEYFSITFTGSFSGYVYISLPYDPSISDQQADALKIKHWKDNNWVDVTYQVDKTNHLVVGRVASLSPFGVAWGSALQGPHGGYSSLTNKCTACHSIHEASGNYRLLPGNTIYDTCQFCHDGSNTRAENYVYGQIYGGEPPADYGHRMNTGTIAIPGGDTTVAPYGPDSGLTCSSCHSPHGNETRMITEEYSCDATAALSNHLLLRDPGRATGTVTFYGAKWCTDCHDRRHNERSGIYNHPVTLTLSYGSASIARNNSNFQMDPVNPTNTRTDPICQHCHEDARDVESAFVAPTEPTATTTNPKYNNFPHETENKYMKVETGDDLCLNCHATGDLP